MEMEKGCIIYCAFVKPASEILLLLDDILDKCIFDYYLEFLENIAVSGDRTVFIGFGSIGLLLGFRSLVSEGGVDVLPWESGLVLGNSFIVMVITFF